MLGGDRIGVLVFLEGFVDVAGDVAINMALNVISGELYPTK
jgi:hypothetical protein